MKNFFDKENIYIEANPNWYDYLHNIQFLENQNFKIVDGAGQRIFGIIKGKYIIEKLKDNEYILKIYSANIINPYSEKEEIITAISNDSFKFCIIEEEIIFENIPYEEKNNYLYNRYFQFKEDPLNLFRKNYERYPKKYLPKEKNNMYKKELENYSKNGLYFTKLEKKYFLSSDQKIISKRRK